jgi:hypothetical protein
MSVDRQAPEYNQDSAPDATVVRAERARAGVTGNNVRYVLAFSTAAVIVALVVVYAIYF